MLGSSGEGQPSRNGPPGLATAMAIGLAATTLGLARFGYGVLLPAMRTDLGWSYAQAGGMDTANAGGYLGGALVSAAVIALVGHRGAFTLSFLTTAGTLFVSGLTDDYLVLVTLRALTGAAAAILFVCGTTFAARLASMSSSPGLVLGIYFAGVGPGIGVSALLIPAVLATAGEWRVGWLVMGLAAGVSAVVAIRTSRTIPGAPLADRVPAQVGSLVRPMAAFTLFGLGYVPFMTFVVAYHHEIGRTPTQITIFWMVLATAATASAWLWRRLLDRDTGGTALASLLGGTALGSGLSLVSDSLIAMLASGLIFGATFLSVISAVTQIVRRSLPEEQWPTAVAVATSLFAAGQLAAPVAVGWVADRSGDLRIGLAATTLVLVVAMLVAIRPAGLNE